MDIDSKQTPPGGRRPVGGGLRVSVMTNTALSEADFRAQLDLLRPHVEYDGASSRWSTVLVDGDVVRTARVLDALCRAARIYQTTVMIAAMPAAGA